MVASATNRKLIIFSREQKNKILAGTWCSWKCFRINWFDSFQLTDKILHICALVMLVNWVVLRNKLPLDWILNWISQSFRILLPRVDLYGLKIGIFTYGTFFNAISNYEIVRKIYAGILKYFYWNSLNRREGPSFFWKDIQVIFLLFKKI